MMVSGILLCGLEYFCFYAAAANALLENDQPHVRLSILYLDFLISFEREIRIKKTMIIYKKAYHRNVPLCQDKKKVTFKLITYECLQFFLNFIPRNLKTDQRHTSNRKFHLGKNIFRERWKVDN